MVDQPAPKGCNVMLRLTPEERSRLEHAYQTAHAGADSWRRIPFATWCRRTLLNLCPAPAKTEKRRKGRRAAA